MMFPIDRWNSGDWHSRRWKILNSMGNSRTKWRVSFSTSSRIEDFPSPCLRTREVWLLCSFTNENVSQPSQIRWGCFHFWFYCLAGLASRKLRGSILLVVFSSVHDQELFIRQLGASVPLFLLVHFLLKHFFLSSFIIVSGLLTINIRIYIYVY